MKVMENINYASDVKRENQFGKRNGNQMERAIPMRLH